MATDLESARDDLAYMRSLVTGSGPMQASIGECFFWAGIIYGAQCGTHVLQELGIVPWAAPWGVVVGLVPTLIFIPVLVWIFWKDRKNKPTGVGARALNGVFQGAGMANGVMSIVFAVGAYKADSALIWFYHPIVVCMFQGVAWFVAYTVLRHAWLGWVAVGWFAATVTLGFVVGNGMAYLLTLTFALFVLMALPGWLIWRGAKRAA